MRSADDARGRKGGGEVRRGVAVGGGRGRVVRGEGDR